MYDFFTKDEGEREWLIAILNEHHFEGFEETSDSLKGYVKAAYIRPLLVKEVLFDNDLHHITFEQSEVPEKNWNEEWEKNFEPIVVAGKVGIRAPFHAPLKTEYEIIIEPKMSFGTGHHATTASVIAMMMETDFTEKKVLDFGSGTGVLAILAEKLKAAKIIAVDYEEWAYRNCLENTESNSCVHIHCLKGDDTMVFEEKFDIILANINRQVILKNMEKWKTLMKEKGVLIISGILQSDEAIIMREVKRLKLFADKILRNNGWLAISIKQP